MAQEFGRRLLRINLGTGNVSREVIARQDADMFLGGRGLGAILLYNEVGMGTAPLGDENKLIFSTGPIVATNAPGSSRYVLTTKSPLTGLYLESISGGYFGSELRKASYDILIVEGKSDRPVYLFISDHSVEIKDASQIWGMTTQDTEDFLKVELGSEVKIACIGPAGENCVPFACVMNEQRTAGRGGGGAVMGSKKLKAIAVRGSTKVEVSNPEAFARAIRAATEQIMKSGLREGLHLYGSAGGVAPFNEAGILPFRNWQEVCSPKAQLIYGETFRRDFWVRDTMCAAPCPVKCGKLNLVREGPEAGALSEGPEYESIYALGSCCDIVDAGAIIEADSLCDKYGLDTISTGVSIAFAMECYEKGILTKADTAGEELRFGDARLVIKLVRDIAYRRGCGEFISQGSKRMAEKFGKGSEVFAMHAKGMELGGYDPRGAKGTALTFACGPRGGCHHAGGRTVRIELAGDDKYRFLIEGKGLLVKRDREKRAFCDSIIMCTFMAPAISDKTLSEIVEAATGVHMDESALYFFGERISNVERMFNVREGLRRSWDTLPERLLKESAPAGPTKGQIVDLGPLLDEFYSVCGWDIATGVPTQERLTRLGLQKIAQDLQAI